MQTQISWDLAPRLWAGMGVGECCKSERSGCHLQRPLAVGCHFGPLSASGSLQRAAGPLGWLFGGLSRLPPPQPQHSHLVIQQLLSHLDANSRSAATVRAGIVEVLSEAAVIAATGSVGKGVQSKRPRAGERGWRWI